MLRALTLAWVALAAFAIQTVSLPAHEASHHEPVAATSALRDADCALCLAQHTIASTVTPPAPELTQERPTLLSPLEPEPTLARFRLPRAPSRAPPVPAST